MNTQKQYTILGIMSGTSLDGVDIALCTFQFLNNSWSYDIKKASTIPYTVYWKNKLQDAVSLPAELLKELNIDYTIQLAHIIQTFITQHYIKNLDAICSHGHTILHQPEKGLTLQIGNLPLFAQILKQKIVCDFRVQDVALGGQGAPLVPIGDQLLFSEYDYCLNLGGFANISFQKKENRIAYDICPVNIVMNHYAEMLGKPYDESGDFAALGNVLLPLLQELNALDFYQQAPPKSLGLEWVQKEILPLLKASKASPNDILNTFVAHIANQIATQLKPEAKVLITGGGVYNTYLVSQLRKQSKAQFVVPDMVLLEYKEALIFGFLGVLKLRGEINCLASVTGAKRDHSSGVIY